MDHGPKIRKHCANSKTNQPRQWRVWTKKTATVRSHILSRLASRRYLWALRAAIFLTTSRVHELRPLMPLLFTTSCFYFKIKTENNFFDFNFWSNKSLRSTHSWQETFHVLPGSSNGAPKKKVKYDLEMEIEQILQNHALSGKSGTLTVLQITNSRHLFGTWRWWLFRFRPYKKLQVRSIMGI